MEKPCCTARNGLCAITDRSRASQLAPDASMLRQKARRCISDRALDSAVRRRTQGEGFFDEFGHGGQSAESFGQALVVAIINLLDDHGNFGKSRKCHDIKTMFDTIHGRAAFNCSAETSSGGAP